MYTLNCLFGARYFKITKITRSKYLDIIKYRKGQAKYMRCTVLPIHDWKMKTTLGC